MIDYTISLMSTSEEMDEKGYVHWKSWQETYGGLMPKDYLDNITLEKCIKMAHRFSQNTLLLKVENKTVGFSCFGKSSDTEGANELIAIYLLKEYQAKGMGYELLKATISKFPEKALVVLWVLEGNDRAINFYKKFGFCFNGNKKSLPFGTELQMKLEKY